MNETTLSNSPIVGIDLGTTNSLVSVLLDGRIQVLEENGEPLLPSVVGLTSDNKLIVGQAAKNQLAAFPDRTIASIKRRMGQAIQVSLGEQQMTPQEVSAVILRRLKQRAEKALGTEVSRAVITVPAFFDENQRQATREAGALAGLTVERIINEPTAASLVYHASSPERRHLMVYDLGGGTFDVSIVRIESGIVEVLSSKGDTELGGDDFDELLSNYVAKQFLNEHGCDLLEQSNTRWRLMRACERAKCQLSFDSQVRISEEYIVQKEGQSLHLDVTVTREQYQGLIFPLIERTIDCVGTAMRDANLLHSQIDELILVGGSTRTPLVKQLLRERMRHEPKWSVNPDLAVALGAAMQGAMLQGSSVGPILVDVATHTLGIAALGMGFNSPELHFVPILRRNSPLPARYEETFYKLSSDQEMVEIEIYQGENFDLSMNRWIGKFALKDLSQSARSNGEILVRFQLTLDGVLQVIATENGTKNSKSLTIDNALSRLKGKADSSTSSGFQSFDELASEEISEVRGSTFEGSFVDAAESISGEENGFDTNLRFDKAETGTKMFKLLQQAGQMLPTLDGESASDLTRILDAIQTAKANDSQSDLERLEFELDDLMFYLTD